MHCGGIAKGNILYDTWYFWVKSVRVDGGVLSMGLVCRVNILFWYHWSLIIHQRLRACSQHTRLSISWRPGF